MPADIPDWSGAPQTFKRKLYPETVTNPTANQPSLSLAGGASHTDRYLLPAGTVQLRVLATAAGLVFTYSLQVTGHQTTEQYYGSTTAPGAVAAVPTPTLPFTIPIENDWDSELDITITGDPTNPTQYFLSALFLTESPGQAGASQQVAMPTAALWQAATTTVYHELTSTGTFTLVTGVTGQVIRVFGYSLAFDNITGASIGFLQDDQRTAPSNRIAVHSAGGTDTKDGGGAPRPLPSGAGLVMNLASLSGAGTWRVAVAYSQG